MRAPDRNRKFLLLLLTTLVSLGVAETVLRIRDSRSIRIEGRDKPHRFRQAHPIHHHGLRPGASGFNLRKGEFRVAYQINSLGMRDQEYPTEKPKNTFRILMLGDSFTEGYSVDLKDTFVRQLERSFNTSPPQDSLRYEVANLGVAGFSPILESLRLREILPKLPGDFVVLNLDASDFADDAHFEKGALFASDGRLVHIRREGLLPPHLSHRRHYFEALPGYPWRDIYLLRYLTWHVIRRTHRSWVNERIGNPVYDRYGWTRPGQDSSEAWNRAFERTVKYIMKIRQTAKEAGMGFALAAFPIGHMVHPQAWCAGRKKSYYDCNKVYRGTLFQKLMARCSKAGLTCWDLTSAFSREDAPKLYFEVDGHFTTAGNALMAQELEKRLRPLLSGMTPREPKRRSRFKVEKNKTK